MYYQTENPHGGGAGVELDFSASVNPLGMPPAARMAAHAALDRADRYPDPCCASLVRAIAAREGVPEDFVLCGNGAAELIVAFCRASAPQRAAEAAPTFTEYAAALGEGAVMRRHFLDPERDFLPKDGFLDFLEREKPDAVFLCNPNNPTGRLWPPALLDRVLDWCGRNGARLLLDECFLELSAGESLRPRLSDRPGLLILRAFTKTYGMAGLRLGYCLSADRGLLSRMAAQTPPWNVSSVAQAAGTAALSSGGFLNRSRRVIEGERFRLRTALEALGLRVVPSEANFILFAGPPALGAALRARGAAVRDCGNFPGLGPGWYRCAVRTPNENDGLVRRLRSVMKELG